MSDAVLVCVGALKDIALGIPGEDLPGVIPGFRLLEEINAGKRPNIGSELVVVGGGNSAIDVARSALRMGSHVTVVYRRARSDMPANAEELEGALEEGVELVCMAQPLEALSGPSGSVRALKVQRMKAGATDSSGRPAPVPTGESYELPCDSLVIAVGEKVDAAGIESVGLTLGRDGRVVVDPFSLRCSGSATSKFFAAGDAVTGPATAAEAMGQAKTAAAAIDAALLGDGSGVADEASAKRFESLFRLFEYGMQVPLEPAKARMNLAKRIPPEERKGNFIEISQGFTGEQARVEAERCLRCDVRDRARKPMGTAANQKSAAATGGHHER
jgi:NADPH-dependent glutamate synthase beta subunit-like oxidoreductase